MESYSKQRACSEGAAARTKGSNTGAMVALILSQLALLAAFALIGFALGWRMRAIRHLLVANALERDLEDLRARVGEAHVRRARSG